MFPSGDRRNVGIKFGQPAEAAARRRQNCSATDLHPHKALIVLDLKATRPFAGKFVQIINITYSFKLVTLMISIFLCPELHEGLITTITRN